MRNNQINNVRLDNLRTKNIYEMIKDLKQKMQYLMFVHVVQSVALVVLILLVCAE